MGFEAILVARAAAAYGCVAMSLTSVRCYDGPRRQVAPESAALSFGVAFGKFAAQRFGANAVLDSWVRGSASSAFGLASAAEVCDERTEANAS